MHHPEKLTRSSVTSYCSASDVVSTTTSAVTPCKTIITVIVLLGLLLCTECLSTLIPATEMFVSHEVPTMKAVEVQHPTALGHYFTTASTAINLKDPWAGSSNNHLNAVTMDNQHATPLTHTTSHLHWRPPSLSRGMPAVVVGLALFSVALWRFFHRWGPPLSSTTLWQTAAVAAPYTIEDAQPKGPPRRIAVMVEPTPFTYICGYQNRFKNLIRCLREAGDEVLVITTGPSAPDSYYGAKVVEAPTFVFCLYANLPLSFAFSRRVWRALKEFKPDLIHATSPGFMPIAAVMYSRWLKCPLLFSYHTHVPKYLDTYFGGCLRPIVRGIVWGLLRLVHHRATLTVTVSEPLAAELNAQNTSLVPVRVWQRGVDSDLFHPKYRSAEMRARLTNGHPERPLLLQVGRLGSEKNLYFLKDILTRLPADTCLAVVGDGPIRKDLERHLEGINTVFTGPLTGQPLWEAYASADVFVMPSETETLGFVVMEAMASAVPVVAVGAGGIPDIIQRQGETGFLYTPGDADEAAAYIKVLLEDADLRKRVGAAGRDALAPWDWKAATMHLRNEYYVPIIEEAIQRREPSKPTDNMPTPVVAA